MKFEHLIQINDPLNPLMDTLDRGQIWRGLLRYVEDPVPFLLGLDTCTITERGPDMLRRELSFGRTMVRDTVTLAPPERIRFETEASGEMPAGALTITIEEPAAANLFVRFVYETFPQGHEPVGVEYQDMVKQAYVQAGVDIIRRIRQIEELH